METYKYSSIRQHMYELINEHDVRDISDISQHDKTVIMNLLMVEADQKIIEEEIANGDYPLPTQLLKNLLDLDESMVAETKKLAVNHFWMNSAHILEKIFDHAKEYYLYLHGTFGESEFEEHRAIDNAERARDMNLAFAGKF